MEASSETVPQNVESETKIDDDSPPEPASELDSNKEIVKNETDSTQEDDNLNNDDLMTGLITDQFCHVCCCQLNSDVHRESHYKGKKHAQKIKGYLKSVKAEKAFRAQGMPTDENRFCDLCKICFSSPMMAKSHYGGKIHSKNLRKHGLSPPEPTEDSLPDKDVPPQDPNKYCSLCCISINNPLMAFQHYKGRKHLRCLAKLELAKEFEKDPEKAKSLTCDLCDVVSKTPRGFENHLLGAKHMAKKKELAELSNDQRKRSYSFNDELQDNVKIRKIDLSPNQDPPQDFAQDEDSEYEEYDEELSEWEMDDDQSSQSETKDSQYSAVTVEPHQWDDWTSPLYMCFDDKAEDENEAKRRKKEIEDEEEEKKKREALILEIMARKREKNRAKRQRRKKQIIDCTKPAEKQNSVTEQTEVKLEESQDDKQIEETEKKPVVPEGGPVEEKKLCNDSVLGC